MRGHAPPDRGDVVTVLDEILAGVREDVAARQAGTASPSSRSSPSAAAALDDADAALRAPGVAVIAEVKRSSRRRKGALADDRRPGRAGRASTRPAAPRSISVLTEERWFGGSLDDLPRSAPRSTSRCCARTSSSPATRCTRPARTAPTWCC